MHVTANNTNAFSTVPPTVMLRPAGRPCSTAAIDSDENVRSLIICCANAVPPVVGFQRVTLEAASHPYSQSCLRKYM